MGEIIPAGGCFFRLKYIGFIGSSAGKESACSARDPGSIPGLGRSVEEGIGCPLQYSWASLVAQLVKNSPVVQETWVHSQGREDPLEKWIATHSSILAWVAELDRTEWLSLYYHSWFTMLCFICAAQRFSYIHSYSTFSLCKLFQNTEFPVLYSRSLFILYIIVYIYVNPKLLNYPSMVTINLFSMSMGPFLFCR